MSAKFLTILIFLVLSSAQVFAQSNAADASKRSSNDPGDKMAPSEGMLEMQFRWRTRAAEKEFNEMIERSDEVLKIGESLKIGFEQNNGFVQADAAMLQTAEKQLKKIRKALGGDDDKEIAGETSPASLSDALAKFVEISGSLNEDLKKSTRHQVSAAAIENANQLLDLIVYVRANSR